MVSAPPQNLPRSTKWLPAPKRASGSQNDFLCQSGFQLLKGLLEGKNGFSCQNAFQLQNGLPEAKNGFLCQSAFQLLKGLREAKNGFLCQSAFQLLKGLPEATGTLNPPYPADLWLVQEINFHQSEDSWRYGLLLPFLGFLLPLFGFLFTPLNTSNILEKLLLIYIKVMIHLLL